MTVCYFGDYDPSYNRTKIILRALRSLGITVLECNVQGLRGWPLYRALMREHRAHAGKYDALFIGFGSDRMLPLMARFMTTKPILWDVLYSLYDNWVFDRKLAQPHSLKAYAYWMLDWLGCRAVTILVLDTNANAAYFAKTLGVPEPKMARVLVGADTDIFRPTAAAKDAETFEIEFHGKYIPVQGTDTIVRAAKLLEDESVHVLMVGSGQTYAETRRLAEELGVRNVTFVKSMPLTEIAEAVQRADVCVGLVGDVPRVARAIPNKLYEAAAGGRVAINADTPGLREVFTPGKDVIGIRPGNAEDFAEAVRTLKRNGTAGEMGERAHETFMARASVPAIAKELTVALGKAGLSL